MADPSNTAVVDASQAPAPAAPAAPAAAKPDFAAFDRAETEKDLSRGKPAASRSIGDKFVDAVIEDRAPAAPAAPQGEDAPAVDAQGKPVTGTDGKPLSKRQQDANRRIQEAIDRGLAESSARLAAAEQRARDLEARLNGGQPPAEPQAPAAPKPDAEPTLDQFADQPDPYLAYSKAYATWQVKQELAAIERTRLETAQQETAQRAATETFTKFQTRVDTFKTTVPDFDAKTLAVREQLDVRSPLTQALVESEFAPQLLLHLAEHPEDYHRIGRLGMSNMAAALREIGRLEGKYDTGTPAAPAQPAAPDPPAPKRITDAPPIGTVLGNQPAPAADPTRAAVARRDFAAFDEVETRKDLERRRK